jgi:hypothetical protein
MPADIADDVHKAVTGQQAALRKKVRLSGSGSLQDALNELNGATTRQYNLPIKLPPPVDQPNFTSGVSRIGKRIPTEEQINLPIEGMQGGLALESPINPAAPRFSNKDLKGRFRKPVRPLGPQTEFPFEHVTKRPTAAEPFEAQFIPTLKERAGGISRLTHGMRALTPTKFWFDRVQRESGIPVYDDVYYATQIAKQKRDTFLQGVSREIGETYHRTGSKHIDDYIPVIQRILGKDQSAERLVKEYLPRIRAAAGNSDDIETAITKAFPTGLPPEITNIKKEIISGFIGHTETNPAVLSAKLGRVVANRENLEELTKNIRSKYVHGDLSKELSDPIEHYIEQLHGYSDLFERNMRGVFSAIIDRMPRRAQTYYQGSEVLDYLVSLQYLGTLGGRFGPLVRNSMQTFQTGYMYLGGKYHVTGLKRALRPGGRAEAEALGFIAPTESLAFEAERAFAPGSKLGKVAQLLLRPYRLVDDRNRAVMAFGQYEKTLDAARRSRGDLNAFIDYAGLKAGFAQAEAVRIAKLYLNGDIKEAARQAGIALADNTQFLYSTENKAPGLTGFIGKTAGAFGNWPVWYSRILADMVGNKNMSTGEKAVIGSRWLIANSAMLGGIYATVHALGVPTPFMDVVRGAGGFLLTGPLSYSPVSTPIPRAVDVVSKLPDLATGRIGSKAYGKAVLRAARPFVPAYSAFEDVVKLTKTPQDRSLLPQILGLQQKLPPIK